MQCNIEKKLLQQQKISTATIKKYILQHLKQYYCDIAKTSIATTPKNPNIQKTICYNISKNHCNTGETTKKAYK
jgi:hypothetical protein